ncbi:MAG: DUF2752 domain-containing protein [Gemmatimonadales bacterium]|nr:DUF2752 domain-containing protein [Gemmatimonadales bacterium]
MRLIREQSSIHRLLVFPLLTLAFFVFSWLRWNPELVLRLAHCPLMEYTGIPCPTCGGTHAAAAIAHGDLQGALTANPLLALFMGTFLLWAGWALLATVVPTLRHTLELTPREKRATVILAALLLFLGWARQLLATFC